MLYLYEVKQLEWYYLLVIRRDVEEKDTDNSDARTGVLKSRSDDDSSDYSDEYYKSRRTKSEYVPVFVPEEEKKKSTWRDFRLQLLNVTSLT